MYSNPHAAMPPPQSRSVAPETFLLDQDAQQSLPPDSIVALQQVDNRTCALSFPACLTLPAPKAKLAVAFPSLRIASHRIASLCFALSLLYPLLRIAFGRCYCCCGHPLLRQARPPACLPFLPFRPNHHHNNRSY